MLGNNPGNKLRRRFLRMLTEHFTPLFLTSMSAFVFSERIFYYKRAYLLLICPYLILLAHRFSERDLFDLLSISPHTSLIKIKSAIFKHISKPRSAYSISDKDVSLLKILFEDNVLISIYNLYGKDPLIYCWYCSSETHYLMFSSLLMLQQYIWFWSILLLLEFHYKISCRQILVFSLVFLFYELLKPVTDFDISNYAFELLPSLSRFKISEIMRIVFFTSAICMSFRRKRCSNSEYDELSHFSSFALKIIDKITRINPAIQNT